jgi:PAS domain S-box-containing protein
MTFLLNLLSSDPYLDYPRDLPGLLTVITGCLLFLAVVLYLVRRWDGEKRAWSRREQVLLVILVILTPLTSLFLGLRLPAAVGALPPQWLPLEPRGPALMVFSALPWFLAAGLLGVAPAVVLGALSGLFLALWETHNVFTIFELALLAVLFGAAMHQPYRTLPYRLLRHPIIAALLLALIYPLIYLVSTSFSASGGLASRLDYALANIGLASVARAGELLLAGLFAEAVALSQAFPWGYRGPGEPSPAERSLEARFLYGIAPLAFLLFVLLMAGDWVVSSRAARQMLEERMANAAQLASENVPYFLETGQNLILGLAADEDLLTSDREDLDAALEAGLRRVAFFHQLFLLNSDGRMIAGYPDGNYAGHQAPPEEQVGVQLALTGNAPPVQYFTVPPEGEGQAAQVSYVVPVHRGEQVRGVLVGRADLNTNPFTQPILNSLHNLAGSGGEGLLLDENNQVLFALNSSSIMAPYTGRIPEETAFYDEAAPDGSRRLVYFQPAAGRPWSVVLSVPAQRAQQMALNIALPLLGMILLLAAFSVLLLRLGLRVVTGSLQSLAVSADNIARGQLDHPLPVEGEDEVGRLRRAFEQMRLSLKARLDELNRLLLVSQGVASSLEMGEAVRPVLESAQTISGATAARVVLSQSVVPELGEELEYARFGLGPGSEEYALLDDQILELARQKDRLAFTNLSRQRRLRLPAGMPHLQSLYAVALRHENLYYGVLWVAFDTPHVFTDEEVRFLATLAGHAALAAANAQLFSSAEIGRQRLAAILASTPDPVLVTDQQNRLLLANPAAWRLLGLGVEWDEGQPIEEVITHDSLLALLNSSEEDKRSVEIAFPDGRVYFATASTVQADGQRVGRVCVLRDVTYFKELDALKSEFVATVSHDLRSPLTLMRGYATMLEMVGELNEQQVSYVRKIIGGVESMSRLVNNLLDLGRIEAGIDLQLEMVPVQDIVERVVNGLQLQATQKRIQLTLDADPHGVPLLEADGALLQQALHNLVENAIKYTETGGKVAVRLEVRQDQLVFVISDTGIGIAPVDQARLFEKFYRGVQGMKQQRGTGLGLAIVKSIAERHGGRVWVESQLGKGSAFYLAIPLKQAVEKA